MKPFFVHANGRLKTGRVALLVFIGLISACAMLYKLGKPADQALVAVKHVFTPTPQTKPARDLQPGPEAEPRPPADSQASPHEPGPQSSSADKSQSSDTDTAPDTDIDTDNRPEDANARERENSDDNAKASEENPPREQQELEQKPPEENREIKPSPDKTAAAIQAAEARRGERQVPLNEKKPAERIQFKPLATGPKPSTKAQEALSLPSSEYMTVYSQWRQSGKTSEKDNIALRITNLKEVYRLFQMKPVAVVNGKPCVDLSDGKRLAPGALSEYSATCFIVSNPFGKWGEALKQAGLDQKQDVEVRYYLYSFIRNAIYSRAHQAFDCCRRKGQIDAGVKRSAVDLLGRAYAVNKSGGGGFGVFVPTRIDLPDGSAVAVDSACFAESRDIAALTEAGILPQR